MGSKVKSPNSKMILTILFFGWIISYIDRTAISFALVQIGKDLSLDASKLGMILSSFFIGYALMQIPGGWLADRFGSRKVIVIAVLFWSLFTALTGLAWSLVSLIVIRLLFGIGEGGYPSASTKAIADYFPADQRTKAQSTMMSSNMIGGAVAAIICGPLLALLGWRPVFYLISLLGVVIVVWFLFATKNHGIIANQENSKKIGKSSKGEYKQLLRNSYLWKVLFIFFFMNIASWGLMSWMPSYLLQVYGINLSSAGLLTAIPAVFAMTGMLISGRIIHRFGSYAKFGVITGMLILTIVLFLMSSATSLTLIIVYQSVAFTFVSFVFSFVFTLPHRIMKPQVVASAFGMINFGGQAAGIASPAIMGFLINASGGSYKSAFLFLTVSCLLATVIAIFLPSPKRHEQIASNVSANVVSKPI
ncbi:MFS transporter [Neobacillus sp. SAB-20_R2A]|uniref:MFS transporter n=1 Tax=Neobacillus sp. SAB-20_R2A TaxID=3120519 RepID=UPI003C6DCE43